MTCCLASHGLDDAAIVLDEGFDGTLRGMYRRGLCG